MHIITVKNYLEHDRFCGACGHPIDVVCCGKPLTKRFCSDCGKSRQQPEAQQLSLQKRSYTEYELSQSLSSSYPNTFPHTTVSNDDIQFEVDLLAAMEASAEQEASEQTGFEHYKEADEERGVLFAIN